MYPRFHALFAEAGDGDGTGGGAPDGGSPEGGLDKKPNDGEYVPKTQFLAALHSANEKYASLEAKFNELQTQAKQPDLPKRYTRQELNAAVEAGQVTQAAADEIWENQVYAEAEARARRVTLDTVTTASRKGRVDSEIAQYKRLAPEILDDAHETRQKIKEEFTALVELGDDPRELTTQLKAIRAVLGPLEKLERARSGRFSADSHRETGGGGSGGEKPKGSGKLVDRLDAKAKEHYGDQIKKGLYKDWGEVEKTLTYASPSVRQRLGIA